MVAPNTNASTEGNSSNSFPFGLNFATQRYQQVYASSQFSTITSPTPISAISFRPDATAPFTPWSNSFTNLVVKLSTTTLAPDALSTTFASNVGANETTVYSGAAILTTTQSGPTPGPLLFDLIITFQTPFVYNPASGNLLLDVFREGFTVPASRFLDRPQRSRG